MTPDADREYSFTRCPNCECPYIDHYGLQVRSVRTKAVEYLVACPTSFFAPPKDAPKMELSKSEAVLVENVLRHKIWVSDAYTMLHRKFMEFIR